MDRRSFLKRLGLLGGLVALKPALDTMAPEPPPAVPKTPVPTFTSATAMAGGFGLEQSLYFSREFGAVQIVNPSRDFCGSCRGKPLVRATCICGRTSA